MRELEEAAILGVELLGGVLCNSEQPLLRLALRWHQELRRRPLRLLPTEASDFFARAWCLRTEAMRAGSCRMSAARLSVW